MIPQNGRVVKKKIRGILCSEELLRWFSPWQGLHLHHQFVIGLLPRPRIRLSSFPSIHRKSPPSTSGLPQPTDPRPTPLGRWGWGMRLWSAVTRHRFESGIEMPHSQSGILPPHSPSGVLPPHSTPQWVGRGGWGGPEWLPDGPKALGYRGFKMKIYGRAAYSPSPRSSKNLPLSGPPSRAEKGTGHALSTSPG